MLDSSLVETEQSHTQSFSTSHGGLEEDKEQPMTSTPTSGSKDCKAQVASAMGVFGGGIFIGCCYAVLPIRRCAGDGSLIFLLCRHFRSHCTLSATIFLNLKGQVS